MSAGEPDSKLPTIWTRIVFPTMWTSCCCQCCADLEDTVKVALRQGTVPLCHVDCRLQCAMLIAMCQADCRCTSCAAWWVTQPVPAEHNNCSLLSAQRWCALFETCSQVDIFLVNTTSMGNIFTWYIPCKYNFHGKYFHLVLLRNSPAPSPAGQPPLLGVRLLLARTVV